MLKKACFARDDKEKIHGNVFRAGAGGLAEGTFKVWVGGRDKYVAWCDGKKKSELLLNICVFDGRCARVILDSKNAILYLPYGGEVFSKLVGIIQEFKSKIEAEKPMPMKPQISGLGSDTKAGDVFERLNAATEESTLGDWSAWTETKEAELAKLRIKYANAAVGDNTKEVRRLQNVRSRLDSLRDRLSGCTALFSVQGVREFNELLAAKARQEKAADIAAMKPDGPLAGIATSEWETLYWAAKEYSVKHAYPEERFPAVGAGKKCVLCMQPLVESASARLGAFHDYMENTARETLNATVVKLTDLLAAVNREEVKNIETEFKDALDEMENRDPACVQLVKEAISRFVAVRKAMLKGAAENACAEGGHDFDNVRVQKVGETIDSEIDEYEKKSTAEEVQKLKTELAELEASRLFAKSEKAIREYVAALRTVARFENASNSLNTVAVTRKGKDLIGQALTPQLETALGSELNKLGMTHVLNLKCSGSAGENVYQMALTKCSASAGVKLTEILSEGEQRVIAIAGFLAELNLQSAAVPIVFDDPVSSLDHRFSEKIAARLVQEAAKRQVIVFTHDISFLMDLQSKSEAVRQYCHCINVRRLGENTGIAETGEPWHAMAVKDRLHFIEQEVPKIANLYGNDQRQYNEDAGTLYGYLRETWEAAIEEHLFNKVVSRFQPEVKTLRLAEVTVERSDCNAVEAGMTKCSKWMIGHALARPLSDDRPAPIELQEDIQSLRTFVSALKSRRRATQSMEQLAVPEIG